MSVKIFVMTHKKSTFPNNPVYLPLQVGSFGKEDFGYLRDDTGDNISAKNYLYGELTGMYWAWKNALDADYIGMCHYRRYFFHEDGHLMKEKDYEAIFQAHDVITSNCITEDRPYIEVFAEAHSIRNLELTREIIRQYHPDYLDAFDFCSRDTKNYYGNLFAAPAHLFSQYSEWLFSIFSKMESKIDISGCDAYHARVFGFISEHLLSVWIHKNKLIPYECRIGLTDEKAETIEVKEVLQTYLKNQDLEGAKAYFTSYIAQRPDVILELSDVKGELRLFPQLLRTCIEEKDASYPGLLSYSTDFHVLTDAVRRIDRNVCQIAEGLDGDSSELYLSCLEFIRFVCEKNISPYAIWVALMAHPEHVEKKAVVFRAIGCFCAEIGDTKKAEEMFWVQ